MPVLDEARHLPATIEALVTAVDASGLDTELVLVDDGSTDGSVDVAARAAAGRLPLRVVRQVNAGRAVARLAGLREASAELVLLLDGRVRLDTHALVFARDRVQQGERVWTGHVHVESGSLLGVFWKLLAELAWREYFDRPRTTSFGVEEFDRYPKGTTCFLAPRSLLLESFAAVRTRYADPRHANDDTPALRELASRERIGVSPEFACSYAPRESPRRFLRHAVHRGVVFLDGHGRPESRFFPAVVAFFPVSAALVLWSRRRRLVLPAAAAGCGVAAAAYGMRAGRSGREVGALALVTPFYAAGHALGMWKGLFLALRGGGRRPA